MVLERHTLAIYEIKMTVNNSLNDKYNKEVASFASAALKGLGQIMLQANPYAGFIILLGIGYGSLEMALAALLATTCGTATAYILGYDKKETSEGLYGFSASLVGVAMVLFLNTGILSWLLIIIGSAIAAIVQHFFIKKKIAVFTFPFVLVTWLIILIFSFYFTAILRAPTPAMLGTMEDFTVGFRGVGQVIFQDNWISGLLFFIAVFISSPVAALYGLVGRAYCPLS